MLIDNPAEVIKMLKMRSKDDKYEWAEGSPYKTGKTAPETVGEHLERLSANHGGSITTEQLVEDSDNKSSPLYSMVERDPLKAASNWRKRECRKIVSSLVIVKCVSTSNGDKPRQVKVRAYPHSKIADGYTPVYVAAKLRNLRMELSQKYIDEGKLWATKVKEWGEFTQLQDIADTILNLPDKAEDLDNDDNDDNEPNGELVPA